MKKLGIMRNVHQGRRGVCAIYDVMTNDVDDGRRGGNAWTATGWSVAR